MLKKTLLLLSFALCCTLTSAQKYKFQNHTLPLEERLDDLLSHLTLQEKISMLSETAPPIERLGIEGYNHGNEALHGVVRPGNFTVFPRPIGLAATFNPTDIKVMADYISDEARARYNELGGECVGGKFNNRFNGLLTFWSPTVNMARDPRWGRTGETYGEDPFLTASLGVAFTQGLQGDGKYLKAIATPKHFVANNQEEGRFSYNAIIPMRSLREYYLQGFRACVVEGGAQSIMAAYNAINGVPCTANPQLLNGILRDEWGFDGYVVGDLNSPKYVYTAHHYTQTWEETAAYLLKSGLDLDSNITPYRYIDEAIKIGLCTEADLDRAVRRVLKGRFLLGMFDPASLVSYNKLTPDVVGAKEHQELSLKLAEQSIVLLKNEGLFPLDKSIRKIAIMGPCVDVYKHRQYSVEESSANPAVTPILALREVCAAKGIELVEIPWEPFSDQDNFVAVKPQFLRPATGEASVQGLTGRYYGAATADPASLLGERVDQAIEINRHKKAPDAFVIEQPFTTQWSGKLVAPTAGKYKIRLTYNGDMRASFNGKEMISGSENNKNQSGIVELQLQAGEEVDVELLYTDLTGNAVCELGWIVPHGDNRSELLATIADCDMVCMAMGFSTLKTGEGNDQMDLHLPQDQMTHIQEAYAINPNIALLLMNSTMVDLSWEAAHLPAIWELWYPGEQTGNALVNLMWGEVSPSGKLPITFYHSVEDLPDFADYDVTHGRTYMYTEKEPLYPFGYGLSYSTFDYSNLTLNKEVYGAEETITAQFTITNSGKVDCDEVAQLYIKPVDVAVKGIALPRRQLRGFKRVTVPAGESVEVTLTIPVSELNYFDESLNQFVTHRGTLAVEVGTSSEDCALLKFFEVK